MRVFRRMYDPALFVLALIATALGLLFIFDAGYPRSIAAGKSSIPPEFRGQIVFLVGALVLGALVSTVSADRWRRLAPWLWWASLVSLLLPEVPGLGVTMNHATRWFRIGPLLIQPSEFAKIAMVLFLAAVFADRKAWPKRVKPVRGFPLWLDKVAVPKFIRVWPGLLVLFAVVIIEKEPDLGTAAVLAVTAFAMMWAGGVTAKSLIACVVLAGLGAGYMVVKEPYRLERITQHAQRWNASNIDDTGYQTVQSELGLAGGGALGVGIGNGRAKHVMPAATTDFVMATVGEEMGLLGSLVVLGALGAVVWRLFWLSARAPTRFGVLVLSGFGTWIAVQSCVNVMMANGTLPAIGIPLAFISSGGSSLVALWLAVGLCQSVCEPNRKKEEPHAAGSDRRRDGRPRLSRA